MPKNMSKILEIYSKTAIPNFKIYDIPSAWPIHLSDKFIISINKRKGIMIGTSGLSNFTSRNTFITLMLCAQLSKETNEPVTVIIPQEHIERHDFMAMYSKWFSPQHLNIITNKLPYLDWLKLLSLHKVSISFDLSLSQGQVSGDCALVNIPSIGGNTTIQTLVYPNLASDTTNLRKIYNTALNLLTDKYEYLITCKEIITTANATISYSAVKNNLEKMYLETIRQ